MSRPVPVVTGNTVFITSDQLRQRYGGRSRAWPMRQVQAGKLPRPYRLGGSWLLYWKLSELEEFDAAQVASAEPKPRARNAA